MELVFIMHCFGNDRSMEEVCRLINKPRTKKEAKMYYKIDTDDVNYRAENENEVSELEIQNILSHFKKLGRNTEKYAGSFENIAAQYTDEQLKIIINCLPINVKAVLEETSNKYQDIMSVNGSLVKGVRGSSLKMQQDQKRTGVKIDIIENKLNQKKMPQSIVIPNSVKKTKTVASKENRQMRGGNAVEVSETQMMRKPKVAQSSHDVATNRVRQSQVKQSEDDLLLKKEASVKTVRPERRTPVPRIENSNNPNRPVQSPINPNSSNRPIQSNPNKQIQKVQNTSKQVTKRQVQVPQEQKRQEVVKKVTENTAKPIQKNRQENLQNQALLADEKMPNQVEQLGQEKRGRGRPRKTPLINESLEQVKPKGKRGRPRKNPIEETQEIERLDSEELPDLNTIPADQLSFVDEFDENPDEMLDFENFETADVQEETADFDDFVETDSDYEEAIPQTFEDEFEEEEVESRKVELPQLDELDDVNTLDENDEFFDFSEESFDEFEDYDEYGQYQTKAKMKDGASVDELYHEDIEGFSAPPVKKKRPKTLESEDDSFDMEELEMDAQEEDDSNLLLDFNDEDDLISELDQVDEPEDEMMADSNDMNFEQSYEKDNFGYENQNLETIKSPIDYSMSNLNSLMTKDKKIVTFLGAPKNGVSFLVNSLAEIFASVGINTAILDMTQNRNSYYIYTQNEEALRKIAYTSLEKLQNGIAEGIRVKPNLTVYTALPNDEKEISNTETMLSTLVQNHSLVLVDCDFSTNPAYFASSQEIYLVQSMDILTIQPLTAFLRELKTQGVLEPEKVRVVVNKELKVRGLTNKAIIGGMSFYNDPAMSFMTELFNKDTVTWCSIPFDETVYSNYLEAILNCKVSIGGYPKNFVSKLRVLGDMVYPLTSRQTYVSNVNSSFGAQETGFSNSMNSTLSKMRKKY